ncbi:dihydrodipicolinate synthase family protein [Roseibium aggregatum]|uniref:dihydrodipicolinate synthase family protein n=1 Tax=Roseibium aggregatum TaxID=187304 RepID=UPI001E3F6F2F|nr:dihydrodipicolinate synthase family protein [Roseibium aggregatum]UES53526.1 dihydrodipicolinate synthase family protein [Roseibium aggregatum]
MILKGTYPVLCTPFKDDGVISDTDFDRLIDYVVACGADGCVYPGVASEVDTLSAEERAAMIARLGERLAGRIPFVVGASAATPEEVLEHIKTGATAGASAAMVMAPGALGQDVAAQSAFFNEIAAASPIPIMLQNAPVPIGAGLSPESVSAIVRDIANVLYVKEETMPCGQNLSRISKACGDTILGVFGGAGGRYITDELARGSLGTMPAAEFTDLHVKLVNAWLDGQETEARRLFMVMMPALNFQAIFRMQMTKETLRQRGVLEHTFVRGKGPRMDQGDRNELAALLGQLTGELSKYPLTTLQAAE